MMDYIVPLKAMLVTIIAGGVLPTIFWIAVLDTIKLWRREHS